MNNEQINEKVIKIRELESQIKELTDSVDALKDEIKADMTNKNVEELSTGMFTIKYKIVSQNRFDTKQFKIDHDDLYNQYCKLNESMRLNIK